MELRSLAYVEAVERLGSFTAAARELHVAQPAVSAQVAQVERELGARLFVRSSRRTAPTEAGTLVAARARRLQAEVAALRADVDHLNGLVTGSLRIGATPLLGPFDLPRLVAGFHRDFPGVSVHVSTGLIDGLLERLAAGELDVVFGPVTAAAEQRFAATVLYDEAVVLIACPDLSPMPATLAETAALTYVCLGADSGLRRILDTAAGSAGFTPDVKIEVGDPQQIRSFVAAGLGVALVARSVAEGPGPEVTVVELDRAPTHPPLGMITHRSQEHRPTDALIARAMEAAHVLRWKR